MVFYFTLASDPKLLCYVGKDKYENEDLIKWGWPEDIWFHVDKHSSAHIYLRLKPGEGMEALSDDVIEEAAQLTKANSIEGNKLDDIRVVYTPWSNLKKTQGMDVGQVGFHDNKKVKRVTVAKRKNPIINKLEKTRVEKFPDLQAEREQRDKEERHEAKMAMLAQKEEEKRLAEERKEQAALRSYNTLQDTDNMIGNAGDNSALEDDFM
jgi:hypothetical protein|mmetsp:Transcript_37969/g.61835  ORF Transcript_37969/g.61835 Transcript_37969/m.61835 type:complete len:209 (-) Transcript_37969:1855-2481(-)